MEKQKILIYRIGSLGDNLVALPAIWTIKKNFNDASLFLLSNAPTPHKNGKIIAHEIFDGSGIFDGFLTYPPTHTFFLKITNIFSTINFLLKLRRERFDILVYLAPSSRKPVQILRDRLFFRAAGFKSMLGIDGFKRPPFAIPGQPLPEVSRESDLLLTRLKASDLKIPEFEQWKNILNITPAEEDNFLKLLSKLQPDSNIPWVGIAPGANQPANLWPLERYKYVILQLIKKFKIWPVILGSKADYEAGEFLIKSCGFGYNFAGLLPVRMSALALKKCKLYIGNDSGPIHLAAAVNTPCVGIYSSRNYPGQWHPYGSNHKILRTPIECEGCGLSKCIEHKMKCILAISTQDVIKASSEIIGKNAQIELTDQQYEGAN